MKYIKDTLQHTDQVMQTYHVNSLLAKVIESKNMGLREYEKFVSPHLIYHDFSLFSEADLALERIHHAIEEHEKIAIYGDYDCDGILSTAILVQAFKELGVEVGFHIPNRFTDGYGLNVKRVKQMAEKGYSLIITVDNGIKANEAVEEANRLGVDVIITDHHAFNESDELPDSQAIIHTKMSVDYPFKEICGGFIAYKLASALLNHHDKYLYSLAAITTVSDMMPLVDENRSVVRRGLQFMNEEHYESLELLKGNGDYTTTTIGFTIAPKINSFGRLPEQIHPNNLVKYFLKEADPRLRKAVGKKAIEINGLRQAMTTKAYNEALKEAHDKCMFYASSEIHEGIVGLVAGKYAREFERPAFVMHYDAKKHLYKGSARGVNGFNLYDFLTQNASLLEGFGGHALAGGFSVSEEHFDDLRLALLEHIGDKTFRNEELVIPIDKEELSIPAVASLDLLEPFGQSNEAPIFLLEDVHIDEYRLLSEGKHLRMNINTSHGEVAALYFGQGKQRDSLASQDKLNLIGSLSINEFRGDKTVNFIVKDVVTNL